MFQVNGKWTIEKVSEEVLILGVWKKEGFVESVKELDNALKGQLTELKKQDAFPKKQGEMTSVYTMGLIGAKRLYVIHLGERKDFGLEELRDCVSKAGMRLKSERVERAGVLLDSFITEALTLEDAAFGVGEAISLSTYEKRTYREKKQRANKNACSCYALCRRRESTH